MTSFGILDEEEIGEREQERRSGKKLEKKKLTEKIQRTADKLLLEKTLASISLPIPYRCQSLGSGEFNLLVWPSNW